MGRGRDRRGRPRGGAVAAGHQSPGEAAFVDRPAGTTGDARPEPQLDYRPAPGRDGRSRPTSGTRSRRQWVLGASAMATGESGWPPDPQRGGDQPVRTCTHVLREPRAGQFPGGRHPAVHAAFARHLDRVDPRDGRPARMRRPGLYPASLSHLQRGRRHGPAVGNRRRCRRESGGVAVDFLGERRRSGRPRRRNGACDGAGQRDRGGYGQIRFGDRGGGRCGGQTIRQRPRRARSTVPCHRRGRLEG